MSAKIDPREVLTYLNELGYTNINAQQLKEFIKDLKKVIKYDVRYKENEASTHLSSYFNNESDECDCGFECSGKVVSTSDKENHSNFLNSEKSTPCRGRNDAVIQKDKHIAVHIYNTKPQHLGQNHCVHINDTHKENIHTKVSNVVTSTSSRPETTESTIKTIPPCSSRELHSRASKGSSKDRKSKVTFIRPVMRKPSLNKSDPVALYHYYQSEWRRSKIPGEDNRDDLRWAIRERMLSGPRVEVKSRCNIPRCGWSR